MYILASHHVKRGENLMGAVMIYAHQACQVLPSDVVISSIAPNSLKTEGILRKFLKGDMTHPKVEGFQI
jgi:hypothetical protein